MRERQKVSTRSERQVKKPYVPKPSDESIKNAGIIGGFRGWIKPEFQDRLYKPKEGKNRIRILAWADGRYFGLQLREHTNVGTTRSAYLCLASNVKDNLTLYDDLKDVIDKMISDGEVGKDEIKKKCPQCEKIAKKLKEGYKGKDIKDEGLWPKPRTLYFLVDRDEEDKGVQIWTAPYFKIDEELRKRVIDPQTGAVLPITDPDEGYDIYFDMVVESTSSGNFPKYTGLQIARSPSTLNIDFYEEVFDLREVLVIPKYLEFLEECDDEVYLDEIKTDVLVDSKKEKEDKKQEDQVIEDDCFGDPEQYGKYRDCDSTCPDKIDCKVKVDSLNKPARIPRAKR